VNKDIEIDEDRQRVRDGGTVSSIRIRQREEVEED
jgi:hypothetical protein